MFKKRKSYEEIRVTLFESGASAQEKEEVLLYLLNDSTDESTSLLIEYLKYDAESSPINAVFNYRGEFVSGIKSLVVTRVGRTRQPEIKTLLFHLLGRYYLFSEIRDSLVSTLTNEFQSKEQALSVIFTQASQENIPFNIYSEILTNYLPQLPEKSKLSYLTNILLSPDFISSDFPTKFNKEVFDKIISMKNEDEACFILLQTMADKCTRPNKNYYQNDYLTPYHQALDYLQEKSDILASSTHKEIISYLKKIFR